MTQCGSDIALFHPNFSVSCVRKKKNEKTLIKVFCAIYTRSVLGPPPTSFE